MKEDAPTRDTIRDWLVREVLFGEGEVDDDEDLFEAGLLDSITMIRLLAFSGRAFGVRVPASRITTASFRSVRQIAQLISQCQD